MTTETTDNQYKQIKQIALASKLKTIAKQLEQEDLFLEFNPGGRKPQTKYRSSAELSIASSAPQAALIQAHMLRGDIPHDAELFASCDSVLDRVMGRARQSIDLLANEEGLQWLESIAKRMQLATQPLLENVTSVTSVALEGGDL